MKICKNCNRVYPDKEIVCKKCNIMLMPHNDVVVETEEEIKNWMRI